MRLRRKHQAKSAAIAWGAGALLFGWSGLAGACKPPQFVAERLDFELVGARRDGQPVSTDGLPASLSVSSTPYDTMLVRDLGYVKLQEATTQLPASTQRYIRRKRRSAKLICAVPIKREPAVPGRFVPEPTDLDSRRSPWTQVWPGDAPGVVEFGPTREHMSLRIERPDGSLELEYRLTHATFSSCNMTGGNPNPPMGALVGVFVLCLTWRRRRGRGDRLEHI